MNNSAALQPDLLLKGIQAGDELAFETLFRSYHTALWQFARGFLKDNDEASDVVQQVFVLIWEKRTELNISSSLKSYLYTAIKNQCLKRLEKAGRTVLFETDEEESNSPAHNQPIEHAHAQDLQKDILKAIEALPDRCRLIFRLSRFGHMSYQEIADALDISVKTVENQMGKALLLLRTRLKHHFTWLIIFINFFMKA